MFQFFYHVSWARYWIVNLYFRMFQQIIDDDSIPAFGEKHLAALTAADRIPWAKARRQYFAKGINRTSLDAIEKVIHEIFSHQHFLNSWTTLLFKINKGDSGILFQAAFVLVLDDRPQDFDPVSPKKSPASSLLSFILITHCMCLLYRVIPAS